MHGPPPRVVGGVVKHIYPPGSFTTAEDSIGARALCAHVKDTPWTGETWSGGVTPDRCTVCVDRAMELEEAA